MGRTAQILSVPKTRTIEALRAEGVGIREELATCFAFRPGFPRRTHEHRENEAPKFEGLWTFGDGPGVELDDGQARVDAELLCNQRLGPSSYVQYECRAEVYDLRYCGDYRGYYNTRGRVLKHIGKRLELLCAFMLLELHDLVSAAAPDPAVLEALFAPQQIKKAFSEFRVPVRFAG